MNLTHRSFAIVALSVVALASRSFAAESNIQGSAPSRDTAMAMILANETDANPISETIRKLQTKIKESPTDPRRVEQLGRLFITKARLENDPGCYKLAEMCGVVLESDDAKNPLALLLRGHALLAMHRFKETEVIARRLLTLRGEMVDHALLGDALMEQGRLEEAVPVYQAMIDAKPCLPSYSRVAHLRWLKGDIIGAIEVTQEAIACGSYRDPEPLAWVTSRLAFYRWENNQPEIALQTAERALQLVPDYPHALFVIGRVKLAKMDALGAVDALDKAVTHAPLPEMQWALAEACRAAGIAAKADAVEAALTRTGASSDPRSFAIYLATVHSKSERALKLATVELTTRRDVFTHDAVAWSQFNMQLYDDAWKSARLALAEGTQDARLFMHAALIAKAAGAADDAAHWLARAQELRGLLLPSEQKELDRSLAVAANP